MKLPTSHGIEEIHRDQLLAQDCYQAMLAFRENHTWVVEEEPKKHVQELEDVNLIEGDTTKVTKIGVGLDSTLKDKIVDFLK